MHPRIDSTAPWLSLGAAAFLVLAGNRAFWSELIRVVPPDSIGNLGLLASTFLMLLSLLTLIFLLLSFRWLLKPVVIAMLLVAAVCAHFMSAFGVVIDRDMIQSVVETDPGEVRDLLGLRFFVDVLALGILPSVLVVFAPLRFRSLRREAVTRLAAMGGSLALCGALVAVQFKEFVVVGRENGQLRQLINPTGPIHAALRYARMERGPAVIDRIGGDAHRSAAALQRGRRSLVVLVVGETARAANFSLNGYARETNPRLAAQAVISFTEVQSCGTATATSLPCMFSPGGRKAYDAAEVASQEGLLDVLQRAGVSVLWRENNSGCKRTCDRVPTQLRQDLRTPALCKDGECYDEILLEGLQAIIDDQVGDLLIVLHQQGSHGPAYHKRSPGARKKFQPECTGGELHACSRESIVNSYDNSILYTDLLLSRVIELLGANSGNFAGAMLYVSDHGESLGENGIYLHGLPWLLAPDVQTHVPMILWLSEPIREELGIDAACLERGRHEPRSHDDLFHSLLGLFDVSTALYRPERDLFAACRTRPITSAPMREAFSR